MFESEMFQVLFPIVPESIGAAVGAAGAVVLIIIFGFSIGFALVKKVQGHVTVAAVGKPTLNDSFSIDFHNTVKQSALNFAKGDAYEQGFEWSELDRHSRNAFMRESLRDMLWTKALEQYQEDTPGLADASDFKRNPEVERKYVAAIRKRYGFAK